MAVAGGDIVAEGLVAGAVAVRSILGELSNFVDCSVDLLLIAIWSSDRWLSKMEIIDFASGFIIHLASGGTGFTAAFWSRAAVDLFAGGKNVQKSLFSPIYLDKGGTQHWRDVTSSL
ncbi:hypothetical protein MLD38_022745 [Melastoma candidum]|uniref:Uncharacterized protein n=1 Tax=Melastoma candidum TaxID=119954 RepID=A0ACB9QLG8_9MYRT|nr:hypothetical protein MLD38_022745 [Melastoma candidum]